MASMTLLQMVQDIMSDMSDDDITSYDDTVESLQVADIIESTYFELMSGNLWKHQRDITTLTESDASTPTQMALPANTKETVHVEYNSTKDGEDTRRYHKLVYKSPDDFLEFVASYDDSETNVSTITDPSGIKFNVKTDTSPSIWTSFDDTNVVFDAYNSDDETFVTTANSRAIVYKNPTAWTLSNSLEPVIPDEMFPWLLAESKNNCFIRLKQVEDPTAGRQAERLKKWFESRLMDDKLYRQIVRDRALQEAGITAEEIQTEVDKVSYRRFKDLRTNFQSEETKVTPPKKLEYGRRRYK